MTPVPLLLATLGLAAALAACGAAGVSGDHAGERAGAEVDEVDEVSGELLVFAAASLTDAFGALSEAFVAEHPDIEVVRNHAGSQTLANQIDEGAPADVFASADLVQMAAVAAAGHLAAEPEVFTTNALEIAVEVGNPLSISGLSDLADPELVLVLPAQEVPAGRYARQVLEAAGVQASPSSLERDVRAARSKVELGEADAAIVFASDIVATDAADGVEIPAAQNLSARYPIAVLADAPNPEAAAAFVAFVRSDAGQDILASYGFVSP